MKLEAAIFDLDGTLLDSMPIWQGLGENYLLQKKLQPAPGLQDALKKMSLQQAAQHFRTAYGLHEDEETIIGEIEMLIADLYRYEVPLKAGAAEYLQTLQEQNVKMCIATATERNLAESALERLGIREYFSTILTSSEVKTGMPPAMIGCIEYDGSKPTAEPPLSAEGLQQLLQDLVGSIGRRQVRRVERHTGGCGSGSRRGRRAGPPRRGPGSGAAWAAAARRRRDVGHQLGRRRVRVLVGVEAHRDVELRGAVWRLAAQVVAEREVRSRVTVLDAAVIRTAGTRPGRGRGGPRRRRA